MKKIVLLSFFVMCLLPAFAQAPTDTAHVVEYLPAPGQFINTLPSSTESSTQETMNILCDKSINMMISLGGYGGYVICKFDEPVYNKEDEFDFQINGNAFGGSTEPGIIYVMEDTNKDGIANDTWYEINGPGAQADGTIFNYEITYEKPTVEPTDDSQPEYTNYIHWTDNQGGSGYIPKNNFHNQSYYPSWVEGNLTFKGTKLPNNYTENKGIFTGHPWGWGYVDDMPNNNNGNYFKLDWAVDQNREPANIQKIHFVKIVTGAYGINGWIGENSTEVCSHPINLHPDYIPTSMDHTSIEASILNYPGGLEIRNISASKVEIYDINGRLVYQEKLSNNRTQINTEDWKGVYIVKCGHTIKKVVL